VIDEGKTLMTQRTLTYRTTDPVHAALAAELAGWHNLAVEISFPRDRLPQDGEADGLVYDLDYLGLDTQGWQELFGQLAGTPNAIPTAVHGFRLEEREAEALRRNGVVVSRRLDELLVAELVARILGTDPPAATVA
jgi:hypothetical protein